MRYHFLPPSEKIEKLEPYLMITTAVIVIMAALGGWAGSAWPWVVGICLVRFSINLCVALLRKQGASVASSAIINAITNFITTIAIILLVERTPNPFWLLFLVETVASALYRSLHGIIAYSASAFLLLAWIFVTQGLDRAEIATGAIYAFLALIIGLTTNLGLALLYTEHENREKVEAEVHKSEQRLRQITDNMLDLIAQADGQGKFAYTSPSFQSILGYHPEELRGRTLSEFIHLEDLESVLQVSNEAFASALPVRLEVRARHAQGHYLWLECISKPLIHDGRLAGMIISGRDITQRKQMEEQVQASLREKEVLLKEIHHRVKNNLQVISSLLNLQSQKFQDQASRSAFRESQDRVRSMALIHEKLYQSENLAEIEFSQYIQNLSAYLIRSYRENAANIALSIHCDPIFLDIDTSVPCGLILNELISNALKHAFTESKSGEIRIEMRLLENDQLTLVVADNGAGFPPDLDLLSTPSLGLQLVNTLVDQLDGKLRYENEHGARIEISFQTSHHHRGKQP